LHLPAQDLIKISGVNPVFLDCIRRSPQAQVKLFLRPSGEPQQTWYKSIQRGQSNYKQTVELTRNLGPDGMGTERLDSPLIMTKLCPLLQPKGHELIEGLSVANFAMVIAQLDELERFGDMILTDPPTYSMRCTSYYKHTAIPTCWIFGDRWAHSKSPMTFRELLDCAFRKPDSATICYPHPDTGEAGIFSPPRGSFEELIAEQCRLRGGHFELLPYSCVLHFHFNSNFASSEYWTQMDGKRAELEQKTSTSKDA
jgi:hypothetical protein